MTVIKRNPNEPFFPAHETEGLRVSEGLPRRVLRDYATATEIRTVGALPRHTETEDGGTPPLSEEGLVVLSQEERYRFQQEAQQKVHAELAEIRAKAQSDLQRELADMRAKFDRELVQDKARTMEEAYAKGFAKGNEDGKSQYAAAVKGVFETVARIGKEKEAFLEKSQEEILALSLRAAQKMVLAELAQTPEALLGIVMDAIRRITDKDKVIIKLSAKDVDGMRQYQDRIFAQMPDIKSLEIHEDARVEEGGCVIETRLGYIDATLETKLAILEKVFLKTAEDE